jgi:nitroimidazol reductase NimA-like FMN-containing flavoprotein (pyridoxamine 5'-phosphate oxidase superfamily)
VPDEKQVIERRRNYSKIALDADQANNFLDSQVWLRVASLDAKEEIWNLPTHFVRVDEAIYFDETQGSILLNNIERYPNVCGVVDTGYSYDDLVGTIIQGEASTVDDADTKDRIRKAMVEKYAMLTNRPPLQDFATRVFVKLKPYNRFEELSWNFGKGHL